MATRVWNQVPGAMYWGAMPSSPNPSFSSLPSDPVLTSSPKAKSSSLPPRARNMSLNFYDFADNVQDEKGLQEWIKEGPNRGAIRVYQPGSTYSELIKCDTQTHADIVMSKCVTNDLYVYYAGQSSEPLGYDSRPLDIQNNFLYSLGYTDPQRIQFEGTREDLVYMFKFVAGKEENKADERVQLTCTIKVKEIGTFGFWSKRFCVLCGSQLHIFSSSQPKGKPSLTLDLAGGKITEQENKKHFYCLQVVTKKKTVLLSFDSRYDQSVWLKRAAKVVTKHPLEANLSRCSLNKIPKYLFLNKDLAALNLSHNFMLEMVEASVSPQPEGWINDIHKFSHLRILSLSDNHLVHFPISVCNIFTLVELDVSCNKIKVIPPDIQRLRSLTTLLLHSNLISTLPYHLHNLHRLTTLVIAFNKFKTVPHIVKELESLRILIAAGNNITSIPEDINRIQTLQILDVRLNKIKDNLPSTLPDLPIFFSLNIRGNSITDLDMRRAKNLHVINCSDNNIRSLSLHKGKLSMVNARNNNITKLTVVSTPINLTSLDISRNELTQLPESLTNLINLDKLILSYNKLSSLPKNTLKTLPKLTVLHLSNNLLVSLPTIGEECSVESLDVHSNKLTELPANIFSSCVKLKQLNISNNPINALPLLTRKHTQPSHQHTASHQLSELRACNCSLTSESIDIIVSLRKLKLLHLAYNSLKTVPPELFSSLSELEYLNLAGNQIHTLTQPPYPCPRLVCLILHSNNLTELPEFPSMPAVETLDLSCNNLKKMPQLQNFRRLRTLDLSYNKDMTIKPREVENFRYLQFFGLEGIGERALEIRKVLGDCVEVDSLTHHELWSYGSACIRGTNLSKTNERCMQQVKIPVLNEERQDGLFAMIDGGKAPDAATRIKKKLPPILNAEFLASEERKKDKRVLEKHLIYLDHTFLTTHRRLGPIGLKFGASLVLVHLQRLPNGDFVLNAANTGLGDAVLCHGSQATSLALPHNPTTNREEIQRVVEQRGFISEDDRVNGICGVSRLLGCYYLHPQVIPLPNTKSIILPHNSSYIILATHGLWKYLTQKEIIRMSRANYEPNLYARRLADIAIGCGCPLDVSVVVIKLNLRKVSAYSRNVFDNLSDHQKKLSVISTESGQEVAYTDQEEYESDLEEEEEELTNIDDLMEDAFIDDDILPSKDNSHLDSEALRSISPEQLDALILTVPTVPEMTPIEEASLDGESEDDLILKGSLIEIDDEQEDSDENKEENIKPVVHLPLPPKEDDRRTSAVSDDIQSYDVITDKNVIPPLEMFNELSEVSPNDEYDSKTFPRESANASKYRITDSKKTGFSLDTSYEQTQSVPMISSDNDSDDDNYELSPAQLEMRRRFSAPNPEILKMNEAISQIDNRDNEARPTDMSKVKRKRSFVQTSYTRLSRHIVASDSALKLQ